MKRRERAQPGPIPERIWAKSDAMDQKAKAHFWRHGMHFAKSACGMLYAIDGLRAAGEHTEKCGTCLKIAKRVEGNHDNKR